MTTELVLLLSIFAFLIFGAFMGDLGPIATFRKSGPKLGARIERNISTGDGFRDSLADGKGISWKGPQSGGGGLQ
jgi:hypothetical protein